MRYHVMFLVGIFWSRAGDAISRDVFGRDFWSRARQRDITRCFWSRAGGPRPRHGCLILHPLGHHSSFAMTRGTRGKHPDGRRGACERLLHTVLNHATTKPFISFTAAADGTSVMTIRDYYKRYNNEPTRSAFRIAVEKVKQEDVYFGSASAQQLKKQQDKTEHHDGGLDVLRRGIVKAYGRSAIQKRVMSNTALEVTVPPHQQQVIAAQNVEVVAAELPELSLSVPISLFTTLEDADAESVPQENAAEFAEDEDSGPQIPRYDGFIPTLDNFDDLFEEQQQDEASFDAVLQETAVDASMIEDLKQVSPLDDAASLDELLNNENNLFEYMLPLEEQGMSSASGTMSDFIFKD